MSTLVSVERSYRNKLTLYHSQIKPHMTIISDVSLEMSQKRLSVEVVRLSVKVCFLHLRGGSICNENPFITSPTNTLGIYAICQTKDQSVAVIMVHEALFFLSKFNKLQTF